MKYTAQNKRVNVVLCLFHPAEKLVHQLRGQHGRRCHKNALVAVKDTFLTLSEISGFIHDVLSQNAVKLFQVFDAIRVDFIKPFICSISIFDFLNLFLRPKHCLAIDYVPDLSQGKGIGLNLQRRMDGPDPIVFS